MYEDHLMLCDLNITFNIRYYMNTRRLIVTLIKDNTIVRMIKDEKQTLMNAIEKKLLIYFDSNRKLVQLCTYGHSPHKLSY